MVKSALKGTRFEPVEVVKEKTAMSPEGTDRRRFPALFQTMKESHGAL